MFKDGSEKKPGKNKSEGDDDDASGSGSDDLFGDD